MTAYLLQPEHLAHLYLGVVAPPLLLALVAVHFVTRAGGSRRTRTYKPAPGLLEVPAEATTPAAEHVGVTEAVGLVGYVAAAIPLDAEPAGPLLCDRPLCPPHGSEAWWAVRHGRARQLDALRLARVGRSLPPWFAELVNRESRLLAAQEELFHHLTDAVFESTSELPILETAGA